MDTIRGSRMRRSSAVLLVVLGAAVLATTAGAQEEPPGAVADMALTKGYRWITVQWDPPTSGGEVSRYIVHLKPVDGTGGRGKLRRPKASKNEITFRNLQVTGTYMVWVRAKNAAGKGPRTTATITIGAVTIVPLTQEQWDALSPQ